MTTWKQPSLANIDDTRAHVQAWVLCLCNDKAPLRGAAGYLDWRLCGALSRGIDDSSRRGLHLTEKDGPELRVWHVWSQPVLVFGFGTAGQLQKIIGPRMEVLAEHVKRAGWSSVAWIPPQPLRGDETGLKIVRDAVANVVSIVKGSVTVFEPEA
jgi:hypothetical protein